MTGGFEVIFESAFLLVLDFPLSMINDRERSEGFIKSCGFDSNLARSSFSVIPPPTAAPRGWRERRDVESGLVHWCDVRRDEDSSTLS